MRRGIRGLVAGVWVLMLCGCAYLQPPVSRPGSDSVLSYYRHIIQASKEAREAEYRYLQYLVEMPDQTRARIKMAILISVPQDSSSEDQARALELLDGLAQEATPLSQPADDYQLLGSLLRDTLRMRSELGDALDRSRNLRDQLQAAQTENQRLQAQIDALKAIETQLNERQQP